MFDWTALTKNPSDPEVAAKLQDFLKRIQSFYQGSRNDFLRGYFRGLRVLDIGAGEHDASCYTPETWEHGIITGVATYALGLDINPEICEHYNNKGYHFKCADATSEADLGERFDAVFIGHVIEHVNNPVALLQFAKRHLGPQGGNASPAEGGKGRVLVLTPNPSYLWLTVARLRRKHRPFFITNFEHVSWVTPTNANEIARRAGMRLTKIYFPEPSLQSARSVKEFARILMAKCLYPFDLAELGSIEYAYEFSCD